MLNIEYGPGVRQAWRKSLLLPRRLRLGPQGGRTVCSSNLQAKLKVICYPAASLATTRQVEDRSCMT